MTVQEVFLKIEHLEQVVDNLQSNKTVDNGLLIDYLTEYANILSSLSVNIDI